MTELTQEDSLPFSIAQGDFVTAKVLFTSTASFDIFVECFSGEIKLTVSSDPDNLDDSVIWTKLSEEGRADMKVASDDAHLTIGTWYFIKISTVSEEPAEGEFSLSQKLNVEFMANQVPRKMQFVYESEMVKFGVF